jgi:hypothetical protein
MVAVMGMRWDRMEKRVDRRYNIPLRAILSFSNGPTRDLETANISAGGAYLATDQTNPEGSEVYMTLFADKDAEKSDPSGIGVVTSLFDEALPFGDMLAIRLKGKVVRRTELGIAVSFERSSAAH